MRLAEASLAASIMMSSSRGGRSSPGRAGLDDEDVGAADRLDVAAVDLAVREGLQLDVAELDAELLGDPARPGRGFERPEKSMSCPDWPALDPAAALAARLGRRASRPLEARKPRASSVVPLSTVAFLVDLSRSRDGKRSRRDVLRDRRSCSDPSIVSNLDGRNKHIVAAGMDVAADHRALLARRSSSGR